MSFRFLFYFIYMIVRRNYSYFNEDEAIQKEFGLFGFLTGTGANAYQTRRDLGNGYSEVTKNTLGDKISNFFNGTKKVRNAGYIPGVNETSYRDGGIFTKIGNKAEAGFNSMKNTANSVTNSVKNSVNNVKSSIGNTLKSSNAMTPTGSIPKRMTKNPQATQLELFNRDGSPTFEANKPTRLQKKSAAIGGPTAKAKGSIALKPSVSSRYGELKKAGNLKDWTAQKRELFNQKRGGASSAMNEFRSLSPDKQRAQGKAAYEKAMKALKSKDLSSLSEFEKGLAEDYRKVFVEKTHPLRSQSRIPQSNPSSLRKVSKLSARPIQAQSGGMLRGASNGATSRLVTNGVRSARNGRGYFGFAKRFLRR
jgi:hypothetical protein